MRLAARGDQKMGGRRSGGRAAAGTDRYVNGEVINAGCGLMRATMKESPQVAGQWQLPASQQPTLCPEE